MAVGLSIGKVSSIRICQAIRGGLRGTETEENMRLIILTLADDQMPVAHLPEWETFDIEATVRAWLTFEVATVFLLRQL